MPRNKNEFDWTDAAVETLRAMAGRGFTAKLIGGHFGISTEAAAAKCCRANIPLLGRAMRGEKWTGGALVTLPAVVPPSPPAPRGAGCAWIGRGTGERRWIECDAPPLRREVYCKKHCRVAFPETGKDAA